jgi:hypothetical protein
MESLAALARERDPFQIVRTRVMNESPFLPHELADERNAVASQWKWASDSFRIASSALKAQLTHEWHDRQEQALREAEVDSRCVGEVANITSIVTSWSTAASPSNFE